VIASRNAAGTGVAPVAGQQLQYQWVDTGAGDTFWVQSTTAPSTAPGLVTIHDNAPTNDRWNYAAVEVTPVPGTISATIGLSGAPATTTVAFAGARAKAATIPVGFYCTLHRPTTITL
jgi:hypothetical protein